MMFPFWVIAKKEIKDNLRDKRSLFFSMLYGPLFLPLIVMGPLIAGVKKHTIDFEQPKTVHAVGIEYAPNLVQFLKSKNLDVVKAPLSFKEEIEKESIAVVMDISSEYEAQLRAGYPALITLHFNDDIDQSRKIQRQLGEALQAYDRTLSSMRLRIRGIDQNLLNTFHISRQDTSKKDNKGKTLSSTYLFIVLMSMMLGGFYLAVDSGAGERERHSLEPLLSLPLSRFHVVLGKYLALFTFVAFAGFVPLILCFAGLQFLPEDAMVNVADTSFALLWKSILILAPVAFFVPSLLFLIGSFSSTTKEAQTHLGFATLIPLLPFFALQFWSFEVSGALFFVPILAQFQLMELAVSGEALDPAACGMASLGTLALTGLCLLVTTWIYRRDKLL